MQNCREKSDVTTRFQGLVSRLVPRGVAFDTSGTTPGSRSARDYGNMSYVNGRLVSVWHEGMAVAGAMCDWAFSSGAENAPAPKVRRSAQTTTAGFNSAEYRKRRFY